MIKLGPVANREEAKKIFCKFNLTLNDDSGCVTALDGEEILGYCLYDFNRERMIIRKIFPTDDLALADGILRSTLHIAAERSVMNAYYEDDETMALCDRLSFIKDRQKNLINIEKLFVSCGSCAKS